MIRQFQRDRIPFPERLNINPADVHSFIHNSQTKHRQLNLEIGCGVGFHPLQFAIRNPEQDIIAIEKTKEKFLSFQNRIKTHSSQKNLLALHAHAVSIVTHLIPDVCIDKVFFFYPNPEKQNPAARWIRQPFFQDILRILKPEGQILFVTNENFYFEEIKKFSQEEWHLKIITEIFNEKNPLPNPRTHFEKKYWQRGQPIYQVILSRI